MTGTVYTGSATRSTFLQHSLRLLPMLAVLLMLPGLLQAAVTASLERDRIHTGDTVTLHIIATGDEQGKQPDLAPLQKNFEVLGTSSSRQIQFINGRRSDKHEWLVELAPLKTGTIEIPPLSVGNSNTAALTLQIDEPPEATTAQAGQAVFLRAEINAPEGGNYVQQQILYTVRLYYRVPLIEGSFSDPQVENAVVERLGEDRQYKTTVEGQSYQVVERHYAIFPEHSGELTIGATVFTGRAASTSSQRSRMDSMVERMLGQSGLSSRLVAGKRIRVRNDALTLDIKPRPDGYTGANWLPSQGLVLRDSWAKTPPTIRAGEPVTRTLTLEAKGLEASQLPDIHQAESDNLRIYSEQAELSNRSDGDWIYGRSEQRFTYVAAQPGKLALPEIRIDWWDSINHKQQTAILPAWELVVEPGSGKPAAADMTGGAGIPAADAPAAVQDTATPEPLTPNKARNWMIGGGLMILAALVILGLIRRHRKATLHKPRPTPAAGDSQTTSNSIDRTALANTRRVLQNACNRADAQTAARALLDWAAATWPQQPPRSLGALAGYVDRGTDAIRELENALYSAADSSWSGQALWQAFTDGLQAEETTDSRQENNSAPPLYPDWSRKNQLMETSG